MFSTFINRKLRRRKTRIGKSPDGNCGHPGHTFVHIGQGHAASAAKAESRVLTATAGLRPDCKFAGHLDPIVRPSGLRRKGAAAAFLAIETMAHRDPYRFAVTFCRQLPAAAGRDAQFHARFLQHYRRYKRYGGSQRPSPAHAAALNGRSLSGRRSPGRPRTRSAMMLRRISSVPPAMRSPAAPR